MNPVQIKVTTGAVYVGFLHAQGRGSLFSLTAGCTLTYNKTDGRYDVYDIMDPIQPVQVYTNNVVLRQVVLSDSLTAIVYLSYLGSWVAAMVDNNQQIPDYIVEYIEGMDEVFREKNDGVGVLLKGRYTYFSGIGDEVRAEETRRQMASASKAFRSPVQDSPCVDKVVKVDFGSKTTK